MLQISHLYANYGGKPALEDINLTLESGELLVVLGPSGCGKTTLLNLIAGIYVFFDADIFNLATLTMVGLCIVVQGFNIFHIGAMIIILKPDFLKTKEEILQEAAAKAEEAHEAAKEAIKVAKEAKAEVKVIEETPEELLDVTMAPKPGTEEAENEANQ